MADRDPKVARYVSACVYCKEGTIESFTSVITRSAGFSTPSHLERQVDVQNRKRKYRRDDVGLKDESRPSDNVGEAMDFIFAGLMPTSLIRPDNKDGKSAKQRLTERHARGRVAAAIVVELYHLVDLAHLDRQAILRATAALLAKCDGLGKQVLCEVSDFWKRPSKKALLT
ncbi:hypothetical protein CBS101457_001384 [Exobasidium rhododendri]|nr:hypothetical protein CBS101457_001384 [Exobasidium rhododendri]